MACNRTELSDYLSNLSAPLDAPNAILCPYAQDGGGGLGLGVPLAMLLILGPLGLAMSVRVQHPGPIIVAGMLTAGAVASTIIGPGSEILALVLFFGLTAMGLFLYQRFKRSL